MVATRIQTGKIGSQCGSYLHSVKVVRSRVSRKEASIKVRLVFISQLALIRVKSISWLLIRVIVLAFKKQPNIALIKASTKDNMRHYQ